jgi:hypothetical protein
VAALEESVGHVAANKARTTRQQNSHALSIA